MKNYMKYLLFAMVSMATASCSDETNKEIENNTSLPGEVSFSATLNGIENGNNLSRTTLTNGTKVEWVAGDRISVLYGNENKEYMTASGGEAVTFTGKADEVAEYYSLYPYNADVALNGKNVTTVLPNIQKPVADGFDTDLSVMVSRTTLEKKSFIFRNVCALLRFELKEAGIKSVTLKGNNNEVLAGKFTVGWNDGDEPLVQNVTDGKSTVTLENNGTVLEKGVYNIVILPVTFSQGVTLTLGMSNGTELTKNLSDFKETTLSNHVYDLGQVKVLWELSIEQDDCYTDITVSDEAGNVLSLDEGCYRVGTACTVKYKIAVDKKPCSRGAFVVEGAVSEDLKVTEK